MIPRDLTCWWCIRGECQRCAIPRVCACRACHLVMDCGGTPIIPTLADPHSRFPEAVLAVETVTQFNREKRDGAK